MIPIKDFTKLVRRLESAAYNHGYQDAHPGNFISGQSKSSKARDAAFLAVIESIYPKLPIPKCASCGATENLHVDTGFNGPYRCYSSGCIVF